MANALIGSIHALKCRPNSSDALVLLQRIAAQVRPIMQKRGWKVTMLREFYPRSPNLLGLNVNHGLEIRIRLRGPYNDSQFLIYEDLVGTMLHELVHIVRGPHDAVFYKLLDELKAEVEMLMAKGYTGDGFFSEGQRLGAGRSRNVPLHLRRQKALQAIEKRQQSQQLGLHGPSRRLGGPAASSLLAMEDMHKRHTPAQMAAMALERRLKDEKWCGESMAGAETETRPESDDDVVLVMPKTGGSLSLEPPIIISDSGSDSDTKSDSGSTKQRQHCTSKISSSSSTAAYVVILDD
ncbi:hypothetical protein GGI25_005590 [Coemansia spiralis]|uniref:WLM domain-containing protein n=2 Tax=Coemansia TaxID=4863 RepID=A0A9W8KUJ1_9FUNG|nr:WLM domain-containing protein [Coemansia spiralis]KAJ1987772.1 hypothetical protein EDC05_005658 [Coemansia umbellata]KAJ2622122.1 hypothetical protein GGI26_003564 [Coemansia sp. RSA 1358]KAJ2671182.1 hypothetical protein GGI25_005590 [Coemansia spiralis]